MNSNFLSIQHATIDKLITFLESQNKLDEDMKKTFEEFRSHISRSEISKESFDVCKVAKVKEKKPTDLENIAKSIMIITKGRPLSELMAELKEKKRNFKMI